MSDFYFQYNIKQYFINHVFWHYAAMLEENWEPAAALSTSW